MKRLDHDDIPLNHYEPLPFRGGVGVGDRPEPHACGSAPPPAPPLKGRGRPISCHLALGLCLALIAAPVLARETIGIYKGWGAFRDPDRCYAIAKPVLANGRVGGFASVGTWPAKRLRESFHAHLSLPRDRAAAVTLAIGERRFPLVGTPQDVWAPDAATDHALVMAMRSGRSMSISAVDPRHRPFADTYALAGAAAAIDAATLACVG